MVSMPARKMPYVTFSLVILLLENIKKRYHGVFRVLRLGSDLQLHAELTTYYVAASPTEEVQPAPSADPAAAAADAVPSAAPDDGSADVDENDVDGGATEPDAPRLADRRPSERVRAAQQFSDSIRGLFNETKQFAGEVPLLDIIRYFRRAPYYSLAFTVPRYYLCNFYTSATRKKVLEGLDRWIGEVERRGLNNRSEELFGGVSL